MPTTGLSQYTSVNLLDLVKNTSAREDGMRIKFFQLKITEGWNVAWPFLAALLVGIVLRAVLPWVPLPWWIAKDAAYALSDALMVGGIVGVGLELVATGFLIERVAHDLAGRLVGRDLPHELQAKIKDIVDTKLVRDEFVKSYRLRESSDGKMELDVTITFAVMNHSSSTEPYTPHIEEESFYNPRFDYLEYSLGKTIHTFSGRQLYELSQPAKNTKVWSCSAPSPIKIPPKDDQRKNACRVTWKYHVTMPIEYSDVTSFLMPTIGATFRLDSLPSGYQFSAAHSDDLVHSEGGNSWFYDRPLLANQHIRVWWFKQPDA